MSPLLINKGNLPDGLEAIAKFYGWNAKRYLKLDGTPTTEWENKMFPLMLPAPLPLSWDKTKFAKSVRIHSKSVPFFRNALFDIHKAHLWDFLSPYGGGYVFRRKRNSGNLSMHAFGAALDFDPVHNPQKEGIVTDWDGQGAQPWRMPPEVVQIFQSSGLTWGGDFDDPMHVQAGSGY